MTEDQSETTTRRLSRLIKSKTLSEADKTIAARCFRRLELPVQLTIFGTHAEHAISLLNLLVGKALVPASAERAYVQVTYSDEPYIEIETLNGDLQRVEVHEAENALPAARSAKVGADLAILQKVNFLALAHADITELQGAEMELAGSDVVLWTGETLTDPLSDIWSAMPDHIRDHSHLVLSETADSTSWLPISEEFVSRTTVNPDDAQAAKAKGDKAGFEASGGMAIVRQIKKEIEGLHKSAEDAAEVLLIRHDVAEKAPTPEVAPNAAKPAAAKRPITSPVSEKKPEPAKPARAIQPSPVSMVRRRFSQPANEDPGAPPRSDVSAKRVSRKTKPRQSSDVDEGKRATPWSLGL